MKSHERMTDHWDEMFKQSELDLKKYTNRITVVISNVKPTHETARNIYKEDSVQIEKAAKDNGFVCTFRGKQVHFLKIL